MFGYQGLYDGLFMALYVGAAIFALLAALYLLFRRRNLFMHEDAPTAAPRGFGLPIRSSVVLRRWTAALLAAIVGSHVWWYVIGIYWLADNWLVRTIMVIMLDHVTLVPLVMAVLLAMLQDRRRPLWLWLLLQVPVAVFAVMGIVRRDWFYGYTLAHYWQLGVIVLFVVYYIFALRQYGWWLLCNYADLERKQVWQSMVFALSLLVVYELYTTNAGEMAKEYMSQAITFVIIAFLVWRVETLQELESDDTD